MTTSLWWPLIQRSLFSFTWKQANKRGYCLIWYCMLVYVSGHGIYCFCKETMHKKAHSSETMKPHLITAFLGPNILFGHCSDRVKRKEFYVQYEMTSFFVLTRDNQFKVWHNNWFSCQPFNSFTPNRTIYTHSMLTFKVVFNNVQLGNLRQRSLK